MKLGIDFGTTRTVVAIADRGNYPVVSFQTETGDVLQWYPALIAARGEEVLSGLDAHARQYDPGWYFLRSLKPLLAELGADSLIPIGEKSFPVLDLLSEYLTCLRKDLVDRSNTEIRPKEPLEVIVAAPANANSNQRFLTLEGFRRAGFRVVGMINEPSAAGVEYATRSETKRGAGKREYLAVYDLGGGTFDASVIGLRQHDFEVLTDEGITKLGGNDFDELLLELVLSRAPDVGAINGIRRYHLLEECRRQKESLHPNTRKIVVDLSRAIADAGEVIVPVDEFYARCMPLVEWTITAVETAVSRSFENSEVGWDDVASLYLVGGSSDLPIVGRMLRERYGRRVRRSSYPYSATAIGLAIFADTEAVSVLRERFTRYFGVWREAESGRRIVFDPIFRKDTPLPGASCPPLVQTRSYHPVHNIGHFRYLECSDVSEDGQPRGDITPWDEVFFPMDPALRDAPKPDRLTVLRSDDLVSQMVEERYVCDAHGIIQVTIGNVTAGYQKSYRLRQHRR